MQSSRIGIRIGRSHRIDKRRTGKRAAPCGQRELPAETRRKSSAYLLCTSLWKKCRFPAPLYTFARHKASTNPMITGLFFAVFQQYRPRSTLCCGKVPPFIHCILARSSPGDRENFSRIMDSRQGVLPSFWWILPMLFPHARRIIPFACRYPTDTTPVYFRAAARGKGT